MSTVMRMVTKGEAERLTERIKLTIESIDTSLVKLRNLVDEAQNSNTWQMLGFSSWTAYVASLFEGRKVALGREDRQALTTMLADQGMSTRAIAPIVGASQRTVANDVSRVAHLVGRPQGHRPRRQDLRPRRVQGAPPPADHGSGPGEGLEGPQSGGEPRADHHRRPLREEPQGREGAHEA